MSRAYRYMRSMFVSRTSSSTSNTSNGGFVIKDEQLSTKTDAADIPLPPKYTTESKKVAPEKKDVEQTTVTVEQSEAKRTSTENQGASGSTSHDERCCSACMFVTLAVLSFVFAAAFTVIALSPGKDVYHVFMIWIGVFAFAGIWFLNRGCKIVAEIGHHV